MNEYMNDEELMQFILDVEKNNLVDAPPEMTEKIFEKIDKRSQILEYRKFRNKVIAAVAAILIFTLVTPAWLMSGNEASSPFWQQSHEVAELAEAKMFSGLKDMHYINKLMNRKEE